MLVCEGPVTRNLRTEFLGDHGDKRVLNLLVPRAVWSQIEELHAGLQKRGDKRTVDQLAADILDIGLAVGGAG